MIFIRRLNRHLFADLSKSFLHGILVLVAGSGTARLVNIASIPLITRLYSPEDFGLLAIFTSLLQILIPISNLHYMVAIPLPRRDKTAFAIMILCSIIIVASATLLSVIALIFEEEILSNPSLRVIMPWWWLVIIGAMGASFYQLMTMWAIRQKKYQIVAKTQLLQSITGEATKVLLGLFALKSFGLMLGQVSSYSGGLTSLFSCFRRDFSTLFFGVNIRQIALVAKRYYTFPLYRMPAQLLLALSMQAPILLTTALYGTEITGQLGLANMAITLPFILFGQSVSQAYYGETSRLWRENPSSVQILFKKTSVLLLGIIILPAVVLALLAPLTTQILFGPQWQVAGKFISVLSIILVPQFISASLLRTLDILEKNRVILYLYFQNALLSCFPFILAKHNNLNAYNAILWYSFSMFFHYIIQYLLIFLMLRISILEKQKL